MLKTIDVDSISATDYVDPIFSATETHADCPRTCTFEVWDEDFLVWRSYDTTAGPYTTSNLYDRQPWASVASDGTCRVTASLSSGDSFWTGAMQENRKDFQVRMTISDPQASSASVTDYFVISIGHKCSTNALAYSSMT